MQRRCASGVLFLAAQFYGNDGGARGGIRRTICRAGWPIRAAPICSVSAISGISRLSKEISDTWQRMPSNILGVPVFALLIWLHAPLWRYFAELDPRAFGSNCTAASSSRRIVARERGYLVMFAMVFDYSRWISNWAVCMFLILHAVKTLARIESRAARSPADDRKTTVFGWIVTLIPRVGIVQAVLSSYSLDRRSHVERALAAMADMRFLKADHQRAEFRQAQPLRHLAAQHAALGFRAAILPLPVMTSTNVRPSCGRAAGNPTARDGRGSASCRAGRAGRRSPSCRATIATLAASERRQRRRGRRLWFRRSRDFGGRMRAARTPRVSAASELRRPAALGGPLPLAQRLGLLCDALPQRALFLAQAALAARRRRQFRDRARRRFIGRGDDSG